MSQQNLANQSLFKIFMKYTSLAVMSMLGISLFILADTYFIANGVGPDGIAALNIVLPVVNTTHGIGWMIGVGGATLFSISKGRKDFKKAQSQFSFTIVIALIISFLFCLMTLIFADAILGFLGASGHIFAMSKSYYMVFVAFSPAFIIADTVISFLRNDNNPSLAMISLLIGGLFNVVFDYLFIIQLNMGLFGSAVATVFSPIVTLLLSSLHLKYKDRQLAFRKFKANINDIKRILSIGFSSFLNEFSSALVMFLFNIVILQIAGNIGVSAYGIIANINIVAMVIFAGIGQGFQPLVSIYYGKREKDTMKKLLKYGLILSMAFGLFFFVIGFVFSDGIVSLFNNEQNPQLAHLAETGLRLYVLSFLIAGVNFTTIYFMAAVEKARPSLIVALLRGLLLILPVLLVMAHLMQITGVWLTMLVVESITMLFSVIILKSYYRRYLT